MKGRRMSDRDVALTSRDRAILARLLLAEGDPLASADFASVATVRNGRREWALPALRRLASAGLVEKTALKIGSASTWRITSAGHRAALNQAEVDPGEQSQER